MADHLLALVVVDEGANERFRALTENRLQLIVVVAVEATAEEAPTTGTATLPRPALNRRSRLSELSG